MWSYRSQDRSDDVYTSTPSSRRNMVASIDYYTEIWMWTIKTTDANTAGQVGINAATWAAATAVNINVLTDNNRNMRVALTQLFRLGTRILLQHKTDASRYAIYLISGTPVDNTTWWRFPVTFVESQGTELTGNTQTVVTIFVTP